jgi:purine nucleoside phosphorylase
MRTTNHSRTRQEGSSTFSLSLLLSSCPKPCLPPLEKCFFFAPSVVVIQGYLALPNLTGPFSALFGPQHNTALPRFVALSDTYSVNLRRLVFSTAHDLGFAYEALQEGVYAWVSGPMYETSAEGMFLRSIGAEVVGMSTVPEIVAGREEGMEVMVLSLVTNAAEMPDKARSIKEEVKAEVGVPVHADGIKEVRESFLTVVCIACRYTSSRSASKACEPRGHARSR